MLLNVDFRSLIQRSEPAITLVTKFMPVKNHSLRLRTEIYVTSQLLITENTSNCTSLSTVTVK
jgi:hypothetical protein